MRTKKKKPVSPHNKSQRLANGLIIALEHVRRDFERGIYDVAVYADEARTLKLKGSLRMFGVKSALAEFPFMVEKWSKADAEQIAELAEIAHWENQAPLGWPR